MFSTYFNQSMMCPLWWQQFIALMTIWLISLSHLFAFRCCQWWTQMSPHVKTSENMHVETGSRTTIYHCNINMHGTWKPSSPTNVSSSFFAKNYSFFHEPRLDEHNSIWITTYKLPRNLTELKLRGKLTKNNLNKKIKVKFWKLPRKLSRPRGHHEFDSELDKIIMFISRFSFSSCRKAEDPRPVSDHANISYQFGHLLSQLETENIVWFLHGCRIHWRGRP